jgi:hypothetical protein
MELTHQEEFTIKPTSTSVGVIKRTVIAAGSGDVQLQMSIDDSGWVDADDPITAPAANTFVAEPGFAYRWDIPEGASVYVSGASIDLVE